MFFSRLKDLKPERSFKMARILICSLKHYLFKINSLNNIQVLAAYSWKEIPGLSRNCTNFQELSKPGFMFFSNPRTFLDFQGPWIP
jgi:hypothetical protein